ncbi:hypothetical protein P154DRAFT_576150 [Amniculicola lignicola CBS 123094]|uniref:RRM domain-containing protein n=1 Tax=Amniculicola lignicola CBS 123094 TaxID=1392246 RepID=A0A6A5WHS4_9PLEO|nr:hypothetical protein P154DRAFT_576150 [Amniculicola lignicola CBS 123094]
MISSPPQEAEHIRGKTLTPESPKPLYYPSPANVPILEQQMDPMFHENVPNIGTPASFQSYPQPTHTPSAQSTSSYYTEQQGAPTHQNSAASGAVGPAQADYSQMAAYGGGQGGPQHQDNSSSIHNYISQNQASTQSSSDAQSAPAQDSRSAYPPPYDPNAYAAQYNQAQNAPRGYPYQSQANASNGVDFQAILDLLPPAATGGPTNQHATPSVSAQPTPTHGQTPISSMPVAANLPARPPAQEKPATHPNYNPNDDIRSYHPHSQKPPNSQYRGTGHLQPLNVRSGAGNGAPENYSATRSNQSPSTPGYGRHPSLSERSLSPDDENSRWPPEINKLYEEFLEDERKYVLDGQWDQFPMGSRLFIGNLPTEKVTKRDVFHRFYRHGKLAQISIKQAYGFVQFLDSGMCRRALQMEQGQSIRGRKMHLEVSKPQRNTKKIEGRDNDKASIRRRSRSPDHTRGGLGGRNVDRYSSGSNAMSPKDRDNRRFRDEYRSNRSPSPPGRGMRGRDRSRDRYDGRRRSRSRSPRRYPRSPSPRKDLDDDLPLPHRDPDQVPDVQVIVIDQGLPRDFIHYVEDNIRNQGLRVDVLIMSPRLNEAAVVRRQILEGVLAIVKLNTAALVKGKINLQSFDRRGGAGNVRFDEYTDLDPTTAGALVVRNKQSLTQPVQPVQPSAPAPYGQGYGYQSAAFTNPSPTTHQFPPAPPNNSIPPNLSNLISSLDSNGLSQLLGVMAQSNPSQLAQLPQTTLTPELARLLGSASTQAPPPAFPPNAYPPQQQQHQPPQPSYPQSFPQPQQTAFPNAALAALLSGHSAQQSPVQPPAQNQTQSSPTGQPDMNEIMAQLAKYQR